MSERLVNLTYKPLSANVTQQEISADVIKPKKDTLATVTTSDLQPGIKADSLKVLFSGAGESSIPTEGKFKRIIDSFGIGSELLFSRFGKSLLELQHATDILVRVASFKRSFIETKNLSDTKSILIRKYRTDQLAILNPITKSYFSNKVDQNYLSEVVLKQARKTVTTELLQIVDLVRKSSGLKKQEFVLKTDIVSYYSSFIRQFSELVDATDDIFGNANLDDDQYATVGKALREWTQVLEKAVKNTALVKADTGIVTTRFSIRDSKRLNELLNTSTLFRLRPNKRPVEKLQLGSLPTKSVKPSKSDQYHITHGIPRFLTGKRPVDIAGLIDSRYLITANKRLSTVLSTSDVLTRAWTNNYFAVPVMAQITDQAAKIASTILANSISVLDSIFVARGTYQQLVVYATDIIMLVTQYNKNLFDLVNAVDDYYGMANIDDDQYANVATVKVSNTNSVDLSYKNINPSIETYTLPVYDSNYYYVNKTLVDPGLILDVYLSKYSRSILATTYNSSDAKAASVEKALVSPSVSGLTELRNTAGKSLLSSNNQILELVSSDSGKQLTTLLVNSETISSLKFGDRRFEDAFQAISSGFANKQNYFAEAYVEPGYVGTNTYFS